MFFNRNTPKWSTEDDKSLLCSSMDQIFERTLKKSSSFIIEGSQEELLKKSSKLILIYSDLITLMSRNRNGGVLIITLTVHANNTIRNLMSVHATDAQGKENLLKVEIDNALNSLDAFVEIMGEIENNGWLWFKDEKMVIKDFLHLFNNPLNKGLQKECLLAMQE